METAKQQIMVIGLPPEAQAFKDPRPPGATAKPVSK